MLINNRKEKIFFTKALPKLVEENQKESFDEITDNSDNLDGQGLKFIIRSNISDIYNRLEVLLGLNLSGHTDTLTEGSNSIEK